MSTYLKLYKNLAKPVVKFCSKTWAWGDRDKELALLA